MTRPRKPLEEELDAFAQQLEAVGRPIRQFKAQLAELAALVRLPAGFGRIGPLPDFRARLEALNQDSPDDFEDVAQLVGNWRLELYRRAVVELLDDMKRPTDEAVAKLLEYEDARTIERWRSDGHIP
jgi:hypothetical protein